MKEVIKHAAKYIVLGIIATALVLAVFTLFLAMPSILEWLSGYIGTTFTWILFIFAIGAIITYCLAE
jgi:putative flippase GtrA